MAMIDWLLLPIGVVAFGYALKRLLPVSLWAHMGGRATPAASACANNCGGCAGMRKPQS